MTSLRLLLFAAGLFLPPLAGAWLAGLPLGPHLRFPWRSLVAGPGGCSWLLLTGLTLVLLALLLLLFVWLRRHLHRGAGTVRAFPGWGWAGPALILLAWPISWSATPALAPLQPWIFTPLWLGYIVTVNGLAWWRGGRSLLRQRPADALLLFLGSALFWWYFEFLNGFVHNWRYVGALPADDLAYTLRASLAFSTVLPAVIGTRDLLASLLRLEQGGDTPPAWCGGPLLAAGLLGLLLLPILPHTLYPLLWLAPLAVITGLQRLQGLPSILDGWGPRCRDEAFCIALAALCCGLFWELWNWQARIKWLYTVPGLDCLHLFEMPLPGYAGYLPFGLECLAVARLLRPRAGI
ncbi:MAG: hypothetical protein D6786_00980 [Gammaproteobacteria bacterium]|nr:MAG: hypothetical protein D6786_00980 [Gammaproteobacteria bacterium]